MKVMELKTPIKEARPRPKRAEDGGKNSKIKSPRNNFVNRELESADQQTSQLVEEIRAMKIGLEEYQLKEKKWREEDRQWLEQKETELMKKLQEFEDITKRVLAFVRLSDAHSERAEKTNKNGSDVAAKVSLLSVASRRSIDREGECVSPTASELHLTDSEIYQELRDADDRACKTAWEIRSIESAITEYHTQKENCTWMKEDTVWLEAKQTELMRKLADFEEVTKSFLRYIGLADISSTQFPILEESLSKTADNGSDLSAQSSEGDIHERIKKADAQACKTAEEIREIKAEITSYQKQRKSSESMDKDTKWLERKKSELICKLEEFEEITQKVKSLVVLAEQREERRRNLPGSLKDISCCQEKVLSTAAGCCEMLLCKHNE